MNVTVGGSAAGGASSGKAKKPAAAGATTAPGQDPALTQVSVQSEQLVEQILQELKSRGMLAAAGESMPAKDKTAIVEGVVRKLQTFKNVSYHRGFQANLKGTSNPITANIN